MCESALMHSLNAEPGMNVLVAQPALDNVSRCGSDLDGDVWIDRLPAGTRLMVWTANRKYLIETLGGCEVLISGHPDYCPQPVAVTLYGANSRRSMVRLHCIRRGMCVDFRHPIRGVVRTSPIRVIEELVRVMHDPS